VHQTSIADSASLDANSIQLYYENEFFTLIKSSKEGASIAKQAQGLDKAKPKHVSAKKNASSVTNISTNAIDKSTSVNHVKLNSEEQVPESNSRASTKTTINPTSLNENARSTTYNPGIL
jgi:hypothetical protein